VILEINYSLSLSLSLRKYDDPLDFNSVTVYFSLL